MILTPDMIDHMRRYWRIDAHLERMLLNQLETEPYPHSYTEQDIHEQSRKMISRYNESLAATRSRIESSTTNMPENTKRSGGDILKTAT